MEWMERYFQLQVISFFVAISSILLAFIIKIIAIIVKWIKNRKVCKFCNGQGVLRASFANYVRCYDCNGTGRKA